MVLATHRDSPLFSKATCLYSQLKEIMEKLNLNPDGRYLLEILVFKGHLHLLLYFDTCVFLAHVKFCFLYYSFTTPKFEGQIISICKDDARHIYPTLSPLWRKFFSCQIFQRTTGGTYLLNLKVWVPYTSRGTVLLHPQFHSTF